MSTIAQVHAREIIDVARRAHVGVSPGRFEHVPDCLRDQAVVALIMTEDRAGTNAGNLGDLVNGGERGKRSRRGVQKRAQY